MEQRSNEWFEQRLGRFTASDVGKLMGVKGLGLTGEDLAFKKACEIVFGRDDEDNFVTFDMQRGISLEPLAFELFKKQKELEFIDVQKATFFPYGDNAGASPDGLVDRDSILEIKCPRPDKFFKIVEGGINKIDSDYMYQMQMQMLCTNSVKCYFFNYIQYNGDELWHEIIVHRNDEIIERIKERIEIAVKLRDLFIVSLKNNIQFDLN